MGNQSISAALKGCTREKTLEGCIGKCVESKACKSFNFARNGGMCCGSTDPTPGGLGMSPISPEKPTAALEKLASSGRRASAVRRPAPPPRPAAPPPLGEGATEDACHPAGCPPAPLTAGGAGAREEGPPARRVPPSVGRPPALPWTSRGGEVPGARRAPPPPGCHPSQVAPPERVRRPGGSTGVPVPPPPPRG